MILSVGEILIDVIEGVSKVGGAPFNVAVNASRLGGDVSFAGSIGKDEEGEFLKDFASSFGFNTLLLKEDINRKTTKAIVELKDGERSFRFERDNTADAYLPDIDDSLLSRSNIIHIGSLPLSIKEGKEYILSLIDKVHKMNKKISFDVNFRSDVYSSIEEAIEISKRICRSFICFIRSVNTFFATSILSVGSGAPVVRALNSSSIGEVLAVAFAIASAMTCFDGTIISPRPLRCRTPEILKYRIFISL